MNDPDRPSTGRNLGWVLGMWAWAVVVWCTVPFARPFRKWVTEESTFGRDTFTYFVLLVIAAVGVALLFALVRHFRVNGLPH